MQVWPFNIQGAFRKSQGAASGDRGRLEPRFYLNLPAEFGVGSATAFKRGAIGIVFAWCARRIPAATVIAVSIIFVGETVAVIID